MITGHHDQVGGPHIGLGQDRLEHREHAVHVRQHGDGAHHGQRIGFPPVTATRAPET